MNKQAPHGFSLVELMVGLTLSLVVVLGLFALYRNATRTTFGPGGAAPSAELDAQLNNGLLAAQLSLQGAGFGIASASSANHLLLLRDASMAVSNSQMTAASGSTVAIGAVAAAGNALLWQSNPLQASASSAYVCQGLYVDPQTHAVYRLEQPSCSNLAAQWSGGQWTANTLIAPDLLDASQALSITVGNAASCWPFGASANASGLATVGKVQVILSYGNSTRDSANSYAICLPNFAS
ncbi:PilW family protein [Crenobacter luteus]|uniref:Prepilin-type N-terminal cleavage/methylation domain-containing protein n=1 Tax=Crenobacter luteus TaxID=1452487 RepID=A0A165FYJ7_9NEIS|nr:prepilin-type N-terminal cleavage/methylation domain-containing protein [Crenobacter luteus]KZE34584.1 hypothetical protein AVW16_06065 [Crenobacter luteus]